MSSTNPDLETIKKNKITELFNAYNKESANLASFYNDQINAINNSTNTDKNKKFLMSKIISECSYRNNLLQTRLNQQIAKINSDEVNDVDSTKSLVNNDLNKPINLNTIVLSENNSESTSVGDLEVFDKLSQKVNNLIRSYNDKIGNYNKKINELNHDISKYLNELIEIDSKQEESAALILKYTQLIKEHNENIDKLEDKRTTNKKTIDSNSEKITEYNRRIDILKNKLDNSVLIVEDVELVDELNLIVQEPKSMNDYVLHTVESASISTGNKKALLCGLKYSGTPYALSGTVNDVEMIRKILIDRYNYSNENIKISLDNEVKTLTKDDFLSDFTNFISNGEAGDTLLFYYSGHGTYTTDINYDEIDSRDEAIITGDLKYIIDDDLKTIIQKCLKKDVKLIALFDCCFSGSVLDLKYQYLDNTRNNYNTINPRNQETLGDVIMISGTSDNQTTSSAISNDGFIRGGLSLSLRIALEENTNISWYQLITKMRKLLNGSKFVQIPQLSSGKQFNINTKFTL